MKLFRWLSIIIILTFLSACSSTGFGPVFPTDTSLPPPPVTIIPAPDPAPALTAYLDAFKADNYNAMYGLLSKLTQDGIALEDVAKRNKEALDTMRAGSFDYEVFSAMINTYSSEGCVRITYHPPLAEHSQRGMVPPST